MITKRMEYINEADLVVSGKLCKALGLEPIEELPGSSARRNLFGCLEDSSAVNELLLRQSKEMAQRSSALWNFDFAEERPLPGGRFEWKRVEGDRVPRWYRTESTKSDVMEKENTRTVEAGVEPECCLSDIKSKCNTTRFVQTSIKGYMPVQKRRTSNRLRCKRHARFLTTDYILTTSRGSSKKS